MNIRKTITAAAVLAALPMMSAPVFAELTGNVSATTNYLFRGVTQTADQAAVQGGIDWTNKSGVYLGTWASNVEIPTGGGTEVDIYGGWTTEFGSGKSKFGLDVGAISYQYPQDTTGASDFDEIYVGVSFGIFSAKYSTSSDVGDYLEVAAELDLKKGRKLTLHYGDYDIDQSSTHPFAGAGVADYTDLSVSLSKDDWSFTISDTDNTDDDYRVWLTWSKEISL